MRARITVTVVALVLALSLAAPVAAGPLEDGKAAYDGGDYAHAFQLWRPLADQGDATAQTYLGVIYANGDGVPQDYAEAVKWYRKAANQGTAVAQLLLGTMYVAGEGVPQDYVQAYKWFSLVASSQTKDRDVAVLCRDEIAAKMTPAQIAEAQKLAREWKPSKPTGKKKP
jgi:hypothetical protein